ncbi:radical SAM protein [Streptomyces sp. NPDC060085]|uniref:radical SAM protein n=1 Tax=Streptomyces sp. NPDC060085 TaxID=3347054 RepID=UPI0036677A92
MPAKNSEYRPNFAVWDLTYACPLRCEFCYSESGRRKPRHLALPEAIKVASAISSLNPNCVLIAGGEPLIIRELSPIMRVFQEQGIKTVLYTSGWLLDESRMPSIVEDFSEVRISVDGATEATHDKIRGRAGSFYRATRALTLLSEAKAENPQLSFGIECTLIQENFNEAAGLCELSRDYPGISSVSIGVALPLGLASRKSYAELELLTEGQWATLRSRDFKESLKRSISPPARLDLNDGSYYSEWWMQVEPDGGVRGVPLYEGVVGNLLERPSIELWNRCLERQRDPFVLNALSQIDTMEKWAEASRAIDLRFGTEATRQRILARPEYELPSSS